jgi:hypothetical protein
MAFSKFEVLESQGCRFTPPEGTTDKKREQSTIAVTAKSLSSFGAQQLLAFVCRPPISYTHSQLAEALYAPYPCREVRTEEPTIGCFIRQSTYRGQS